MRRVLGSIGLAACLLAGAVAPAFAAPPAKTCSQGGFQAYALNLTWQHGDPVPGPGDEWWALTLTGIAAEGLTPEAAATLFGFDTVDALYEAVLLGIRGLDKNGDGAVCAKPFPEHANGQPAYIFNAVDGNARDH